jgi:hypothetical protein
VNLDDVRKFASEAGLSRAEMAAAEAFVMSRMGNRELLWLVVLGLVVLAKKAAGGGGHGGGAGPRYSLAELRDFAVAAGFQGADADIAAAIAMAESDGYLWAQGDPRGAFGPTPNGTSTSFGLWQVHTPVHPQYDAARLLTDAAYSARAAFEIRSTPQGFHHWSTYNPGPGGKAPEYLKYMPTA